MSQPDSETATQVEVGRRLLPSSPRRTKQMDGRLPASGFSAVPASPLGAAVLDGGESMSKRARQTARAQHRLERLKGGRCVLGPRHVIAIA